MIIGIGGLGSGGESLLQLGQGGIDFGEARKDLLPVLTGCIGGEAFAAAVNAPQFHQAKGLHGQVGLDLIEYGARTILSGASAWRDQKNEYNRSRRIGEPQDLTLPWSNVVAGEGGPDST
jgi:hypothetical protein